MRSRESRLCDRRRNELMTSKPLLTFAFESVFGLGPLGQLGEVGQRQRGAVLQVDALHPLKSRSRLGCFSYPYLCVCAVEIRVPLESQLPKSTLARVLRSFVTSYYIASLPPPRLFFVHDEGAAPGGPQFAVADAAASGAAVSLALRCTAVALAYSPQQQLTLTGAAAIAEGRKKKGNSPNRTAVKLKTTATRMRN